MEDTEVAAEMAPRYDAAKAEQRWYLWWERNGLFKPSEDSDAPKFVITIPPPNVTGDLHIGHVLTYGIEDLLGRFKRMQGFNTLILPGTDHAGIATQNVVERVLAGEGKSRHDLGRDAFIARVWQWKAEYADHIRRQFQTLGCAFDWSRERFTLDSGYADAVLEFFIRLHGEGKIYRGWRVINWCVRCHSAISDIEVEDEERQDTLYYLRYPLSDASGDITVATVRPETILGDVAVAVNPADPRYRDLIGKTAILPLLGRRLMIIADAMVEMSFGTGAVKITPAHDFNDFEVGERHHLDMPIAISPDAQITSVGGPYAGLSVAEAKTKILSDLENGGYLVKSEAHTHLVPTCERCGTLLEPLLSEQWFMRMEELAQPAIDAVRDGRVTFVPERWTRVYLEWMEKIRPWTLSRQLWWGHRIPVYYCENGHTTASKTWPEACVRCPGNISHQDPDVLDTWFSSALWPFATLGWPEDTADLRTFYPTSFMNTSSQILYLWIARMIMMGLKFMDEIPFPVVLINPTVLNKTGQRMSKSLGTGRDPVELIAEFGADALRFALMTSGSTHQQDVRFSEERVEQARNFTNKVWNIARAVVQTQLPDSSGTLDLTVADRWILSRLQGVVADVTASLERFEPSSAGQAIFDFVWNEFADWYLEIAKLRLYDSSDANGQFTAQAVLWSVLDRCTRILHPYMPFLTEEIFQHLRTCGSPAARALADSPDEDPTSIMLAPWPVAGERDPVAEAAMKTVIETIREIRAARSEHAVEAAKYIPAAISAGASKDVLQVSGAIITKLARVRPLTWLDVNADPPVDSVPLMVADATTYLPLKQMTNVEAERRRLLKESQNARAALESVAQKLSNQSFLERAPEDVVTRERDRRRELTDRLQRLSDQFAAIDLSD